MDKFDEDARAVLAEAQGGPILAVSPERTEQIIAAYGRRVARETEERLGTPTPIVIVDHSRVALPTARERWLLSDVAHVGRTSIEVEKFVELQALARRFVPPARLSGGVPLLGMKPDTRSPRWKAAEARIAANLSNVDPIDLAICEEEQVKWDAANPEKK